MKQLIDEYGSNIISELYGVYDTTLTSVISKGNVLEFNSNKKGDRIFYINEKSTKVNIPRGLDIDSFIDKYSLLLLSTMLKYLV